MHSSSSALGFASSYSHSDFGTSQAKRPPPPRRIMMPGRCYLKPRQVCRLSLLNLNRDQVKPEASTIPRAESAVQQNKTAKEAAMEVIEIILTAVNNFLTSLGLPPVSYHDMYPKRAQETSSNEMNPFISDLYYSSGFENNVDARCKLGYCYLYGFKIEKDISKAIYHLELAEKKNNIEAQHMLGMIYSNMENDCFDMEKSIKYLTLAADKGYLGLIYYEDQLITKNIPKTLKYLTLAANQNYPEALYELGLMCINDQSVPRNINKAVEYFTILANQGNSFAQAFIGMYYFESYVDAFNTNKALYYLTLSAKQNNSDTQYNLTC